MRILYHHRVGSRDGQAIHIDELIHALRSLGHDVDVVAPPGFEASVMGEGSKLAAWFKRHLPKFVYELVEVAYNLAAYLRLRRALRQAKPDLIYERYGLFLIAGTVLSRRTGIPLFLEVNSPLARERMEFGGLALKALAKPLEAWTWQSARRVLPVTEVLAETLRCAGVSSERITVIPNAIDPDRFPQDPDTEAAKAAIGLSGKVVLGFVGFIRDWHGLDTVIEFLAQPTAPPLLHLLIIGDGPAQEKLECQASALEVRNRITFAGLVSRDDIAKLVGAFDIALQPRAMDYASPLKLFEYMALSKAIVAPNQPNIRETLAHDVNALLFEPDDPAAMAAAIVRLAGDGKLRERLGKAARKTIFDRSLTWQSNARKISALATSSSEKKLANSAVVQSGD